MSASGYIAAPNRSAHAAPSPYWAGQGGAGGTIAAPSREVATATPPPPPSGGVHGQIKLYRPGIDRNNPFPLFEGLTGWSVTHHVRNWLANFQGILKFTTDSSGPLAWTTNRVTNSLGSSDGIRVDSRFDSATYRQEFNTKIYADYLPTEKVQRDQYLVISTATSNERMVQPYFNRLTQWQSNPPYAAQTEVLK